MPTVSTPGKVVNAHFGYIFIRTALKSCRKFGQQGFDRRADSRHTGRGAEAIAALAPLREITSGSVRKHVK